MNDLLNGYGRAQPGRLLRDVAIWTMLALLCCRGADAEDRRRLTSLLELRHEHVILQQWDISCGAAALATLLNYQHGDAVTEREVARELMSRAEYLNTPQLINIRQGFSLLDLKRFADGRGYAGLGYGQLSLGDLQEKAPVMVPIRVDGYNHFVIFRGMKGNRVLLADPAWGNRTLPLDRFEQLWIDFPQLGKVGFIVSRRDGEIPPNGLAPQPEDFVMLR